jgi:hypothetical protein
MAVTSKNKFILIELGLAEEQLTYYKKFLQDNPYDSFVDRIQWKETKGGGAMPLTVATIEAQQKNHRETMKDYLALLEVINKLRTEDEKVKVSMRNDQEVPDIMK